MARLRLADLEIDALDRRIAQGTRELRLSPSEHIVLYTLAAKRGAVVSYRVIADALGMGPGDRTNAVARHIASLRRKLGDDAERRRYIATVSRIGYRFVVVGTKAPEATPRRARSPAAAGRRRTPPPR